VSFDPFELEHRDFPSGMPAAVRLAMLEHNTQGLSFFHSVGRFHSVSRLTVVVGALVAATGCSLEAGDLTTNGLSAPVAAGASTSVEMGTTATIDHAKSSDPTVLVVTGQGFDTVNVTAGQVGSATITAYDASNNVLATNVVQVAPTTAIALDPGVSNGITVLVGEPYAVHATTMGANGVTLVGDGAIHFAYQGGLVASSNSGGCFFGGDCGGFQFDSPGGGQVVMTATSATTTLTLRAVSAVDTFTISQSSVDVPVADANQDAGEQITTLTFTILAAGAPVTAQVLCTAADPNKVLVLPSFGSELGAPGETLGVAGLAVGSTTVTCTVGGQSATLAVNVK
jgi:hypothetical protein